MKAKLTLLADGDEHAVVKVFDWNEVLTTTTGHVRVAEISVYTDTPVIDGKEYRIAHMLSGSHIC